MKMWIAVLMAMAHFGAAYDAYNTHPSCFFNPLCTCSRSVPDLGIVTCSDVSMSRIPPYLNNSRINSLILENNGIRAVEPNFLYGTGLHSFRIMNNPLLDLHPEVFNGLEYSLRELELSRLGLIHVPQQAIYRLLRLHHLNLAGNDISELNSESFHNVRNTLETLILSENAITHIPRNAFGSFLELKVLDLSRNAISELDPNVFYPSTTKITQLLLSDNQLTKIPYEQLYQLRSLRTLDLRYNLITKINVPSDQSRVQFMNRYSLHSLRLDYNRITEIASKAFERFESLNKTILDGNPIGKLKPDIFQNARIAELSFSSCALREINPYAFQGLEPSLKILDLSHNGFSSLHPNLFDKFESLQSVNLKGNDLTIFPVPASGLTLQALDLSEQTNKAVLIRELQMVKNLRVLALSKLRDNAVRSEDFYGFGSDLDELRITDAFILTVKGHAFLHARSLRKLDLSNNAVEFIDADAFAEIGHSLLSLYLINAFSHKVRSFPSEYLRHVTNLYLLDASSNNFEELHESSFHSLPRAQVIRMHDCHIRNLYPETFKSDIHTSLKEVVLSYNALTYVGSGTFTDLEKLQYVNLEDNLLEKVEAKSFSNLAELKWLHLRGNQIRDLEEQAFQNLPKLEALDLAYNKLENFNFVSLDQVGSTSAFVLNVSYNALHFLSTGSGMKYDEIPGDCNVKVMDASHNIIYQVAHGYFRPIEASLTHLYFDYNALPNVSRETFGNFHDLQWMGLSHNKIRGIDHNTFKNMGKLQVVRLDYNYLEDVPFGLFQGMKHLRVVDLTQNRLRHLPDLIFRDASLERVSLARNHFNQIPFKAFTSEAAVSLLELDMSGNHISTIQTPEHFQRFTSLLSLDLSNNRIVRLDDAMFEWLRKLSILDLSHNPMQLMEHGHRYYNLEKTLTSLHLKNTSLYEFPDLPLRALINLDLSDNEITDVPAEASANITNLRILDISGNKLTAIPTISVSLPHLKVLRLAGNNITSVANASLLNSLQKLRRLDISKLPLENFEPGALNRLISLVELNISSYRKVEHYNIPGLLEQNFALEKLRISVEDKMNLDSEMIGKFPPKLREIAITGKSLRYLSSEALEGVSFPALNLSISNTSLERIDQDFFKRMRNVRNLTLDVRNNSLRVLENPSTTSRLGIPNRIFLLELRLEQNPWNCRCDIGWVEAWERRRRQLLCPGVNYYHQGQSDCYRTSDDLRSAYCGANRKLLQVLKTELDCAFGRASTNDPSILFSCIFIIYVALYADRI